MNKISVVIDTDGQMDSLWGLILAKQFLDIKAITVCAGKNEEAKNVFENVPSFVQMAGIKGTNFERQRKAGADWKEESTKKEIQSRWKMRSSYVDYSKCI